MAKINVTGTDIAIIKIIGEWKLLFNPNFNYTEFGTIKNSAGSNNFVLSVKQWI